MICRKCGRSNPQNVDRCVYCNSYLQRRNAPNSNRQKSDKALVATIISLVLIFALLLGAYAVQEGFPFGGNGFTGSGGGGGGGGGSGIQMPVSPFPTPSEVASVILDGEDPDVELFSFGTDTYDIMIGNTQTVTFTAEIFANVALSDSDVKVIDENFAEIGFMNDSGINGDSVAGDGVYTLQKELTADAQKNTMYFATVNNLTSFGVNIGYYRVFTGEDFALADQIASKLNELTQPHMNADRTVNEDKLQYAMKAVTEYLTTQKSTGNVSSYTTRSNSAHIKLSTGYSFVYSLEIAGLSAGGSNVTIASYAPFDSLRGDMEPLYDEALDGTAQNISTTFGNYTFTSAGNHDLGEVTLDALKHLSDNKVIIWGGHGGYDNSPKGYGSSLMTGEIVNNETSAAYSADISSERVLTRYSASGRNAYTVTGGFFDKYLGNMDGAFVYLSACHSGQDMIDNVSHRYRLAQSFINKGAQAVVANSESIYSQYTYKMERDIINRMCVAKDDGTFYTVSEALEYAKSINGNTDGSSRGSKPMIFPQGRSSASNYTFGHPGRGTVSGAVKSAENNEPIANALVRVYNETGEYVVGVRTDNEGYYNINLPVGSYVLKITKGHYRSSKIVITITNGITVYNETFLLLKVTNELNTAHGVITDALTGLKVADVSINLRFSWNNETGTVIDSLSTDSEGKYLICCKPGFYTIEYSKPGYITGYKNIIVGIPESIPQNAAISPEMPDDGAFRIVLSWSNTPKDLDSHLTGPSVDGDRFHLYYEYADTYNTNVNSDYQSLDLDNTDIISHPNVPETITISRQLEGVYRYSVHDFTNQNNSGSTALGQSNAIVTVYKGSKRVAIFNVPPTAKGTIWTVFEISGNELKVLNTIGNGSDHDISKF